MCKVSLLSVATNISCLLLLLLDIAMQKLNDSNVGERTLSMLYVVWKGSMIENISATHVMRYIADRTIHIEKVFFILICNFSYATFLLMGYRLNRVCLELPNFGWTRALQGKYAILPVAALEHSALWRENSFVSSSLFFSWPLLIKVDT